jgi:hypothetical protein
MTLDHERPYFHLTIAGCRRVGALGGRRSAQNRKLRQASQVHASQENAEVPLETAAEAIAALDRQFPWLRGAERRNRGRATNERDQTLADGRAAAVNSAKC